jgi:hypothetical protein
MSWNSFVLIHIIIITPSSTDKVKKTVNTMVLNVVVTGAGTGTLGRRAGYWARNTSTQPWFDTSSAGPRCQLPPRDLEPGNDHYQQCCGSGSGSISQRYGSGTKTYLGRDLEPWNDHYQQCCGSGSRRIHMFLGLPDMDPAPDLDTGHHQAKIVRKTFFPTVLRLLYDFLFLKNDVKCTFKK